MASAPSRLTRVMSWRWLRSLASDTAGAALVEITLFMPILALMSVAIINFGLYFWYSIQVENAAQVGAQWDITNAWQQNPYSSSSIQNAGTAANNASQPSVYSKKITVTPTWYCSCPISSGVTPSATASPPSCAIVTSTNLACSDGSVPGTYVQVVASGTFKPFAQFGSFFKASYPVSYTATVRVQ